MRIVSGSLKGKKLTPPTTHKTRPTTDRTRESLFNILEHNPAFAPFRWEGKRVLDVFAGTGALGLEALSRGAEFATFVDMFRPAVQVIQKNINDCNMVSKARMLSCEAIKVPQTKECCQVIFMDPPYSKGLVGPALEHLIAKGWVETGTVILGEVEKSEDLPKIVGCELVIDRQIGSARVFYFIYQG